MGGSGGNRWLGKVTSLLLWRNEEIFSRVDQANLDLSKKASEQQDLERLISQGLGFD